MSATSPAVAFFEAAQLTVPADVDQSYPPILTNQITERVRARDKVNNPTEGRSESLQIGWDFANKIVARVQDIAGVTLPKTIAIISTAPRDGVVISYTKESGIKEKPLIAVLAGNTLIDMNEANIAKIETEIYTAFGNHMRPLIVRHDAPQPLAAAAK